MTNYKQMLAGLQGLMNNPTPRIAIALCLDVSSSMDGEPIDELNAGVGQYLTEIYNDDMTRNSAETAIITFADEAECLLDFNTVDQLALTPLEANGMTDMGKGLTLALDLLDKRKQQYKTVGVEYYQPILVVMSDGEPNGNPKVLKQATSRIQQMIAERKLTVIAVGIGENADMKMLNQLTRRGAVRMNGLYFREFFAWLSRSVAEVSASNPGDDFTLDQEALSKLESEPWMENTL